MARRTRRKVEVGSESRDMGLEMGGEASQPDNGAMALTELEMMQLMVHEQRVEMNRAQGEKFALQEQLLNINYIKQRDELRMRQRECIAAMERAKDDYNKARAAVQARLGIDLDKYTVNEVGQLMAVPQAEN